MEIIFLMSKKIILGILIVVVLISGVFGFSYFRNKNIEKNLENTNIDKEVLPTPEVEITEKPIEETIIEPTNK